MGLISGFSSMQYGMIVPCLSFAVILAFAMVRYAAHEKESAPS